jgi:hypothetical protein
MSPVYLDERCGVDDLGFVALVPTHRVRATMGVPSPSFLPERYNCRATTA